MKLQGSTKIYKEVPSLLKYKNLAEQVDFPGSPMDLFLYLTYGGDESLVEGSDKVEIKKVANVPFYYWVDPECNWFKYKGDISHLKNDSYYISIHRQYLSTFKKSKELPHLFTNTRFRVPIITSDGIRYYTVANYYAAMMTVDYTTREYISKLSPFSALQYWDDYELAHQRSDVLKVKMPVMEKALYWLFVESETSWIHTLDNINILYTNDFPIFGSHEDSSYWGFDGTFDDKVYGLNNFGNLLSKLKYHRLYGNAIPF